MLVNGEKFDIQSLKSNNIMSLLTYLNLDSKRVAIILNNNVCDEQKIESVKLVEGDKLEIVHFAGGG